TTSLALPVTCVSPSTETTSCDSPALVDEPITDTTLSARWPCSSVAFPPITTRSLVWSRWRECLRDHLNSGSPRLSPGAVASGASAFGAGASAAGAVGGLSGASTLTGGG